MDTREVITKYFKYVNAGEWDKYLDLYADNVIMDEQLMGHMEGKQAVAEGIENLKNAPKFENHLLDMVVEGDRAMARWHISTVPAPGINIEVDGVNYFEIKGGKIVHFANYHDTAPFAPLFQK
jgi:ketosteroid isomerase-like protein